MIGIWWVRVRDYINKIVVMNILEGVKPVNLKNTTTKFIIKSKPSSKENKASIDS